MRRGILGAVGSRVEDVSRLRSDYKPIAVSPQISSFRRRVKGAIIEDIGRVGKRVVIWLNSEDAIVIEPRMTGLVLIVDPPSEEHLRWRLKLAGGAIDEILYWDRRGLGSVRLLSREQFELKLGPGVIGPDALKVDVESLRKQLGRSQREIKPALLDQQAVSGIGNLYASEILHVAGIHPQRRCKAMNQRQWQALVSATQYVLEEAIRYEGSTLSDGTYRNALNRQGTYQNEHRVYNRADEECHNCWSSSIKRIVQAQRSTFYCPRCQTRSGVAHSRRE